MNIIFRYENLLLFRLEPHIVLSLILWVHLKQLGALKNEWSLSCVVRRVNFEIWHPGILPSNPVGSGSSPLSFELDCTLGEKYSQNIHTEYYEPCSFWNCINVCSMYEIYSVHNQRWRVEKKLCHAYLLVTVHLCLQHLWETGGK